MPAGEGFDDMKRENLTRGQKCFLTACVGAAAMAVLACMTYLVPACVDMILNSDGFFADD